jgi:hypothetical protein
MAVICMLSQQEAADQSASELKNARRAAGYAHMGQAIAKLLWYKIYNVVNAEQTMFPGRSFASIVAMSL